MPLHLRFFWGGSTSSKELLHLLASLLFEHSPPEFLNLVNCSIALANESTPLLLSNFSHLKDQTLLIL